MEEADLERKGMLDCNVEMHGRFQQELTGRSDLLSTAILEESSSGEF